MLSARAYTSKQAVRARRRGLNRLDCLRRVTREPVRYEHDAPGTRPQPLRLRVDSDRRGRKLRAARWLSPLSERTATGAGGEPRTPQRRF